MTKTDPRTKTNPSLASVEIHEFSELFSGAQSVALASAILDLLASSGHPLTRREIAVALAVRPERVSSHVDALEADGYVVSSRRFAVTLGVRFMDDAALSRVFRDTTLALARPYLDSLAHRFDGTAALAFGTRGTSVIAETSGQARPSEIEPAIAPVLDQAIRGADAHSTAPALELRGVWAGYATENTIVIASRVRLHSRAGAALAFTTRTLTLDQFSELSQAVAQFARELSNALRRIYPLTASPVSHQGTSW